MDVTSFLLSVSCLLSLCIGQFVEGMLTSHPSPIFHMFSVNLPFTGFLSMGPRNSESHIMYLQAHLAMMAARWQGRSDFMLHGRSNLISSARCLPAYLHLPEDAFRFSTFSTSYYSRSLFTHPGALHGYLVIGVCPRHL